MSNDLSHYIAVEAHIHNSVWNAQIKSNCHSIPDGALSGSLTGEDIVSNLIDSDEPALEALENFLNDSMPEINVFLAALPDESIRQRGFDYTFHFENHHCAMCIASHDGEPFWTGSIGYDGCRPDSGYESVPVPSQLLEAISTYPAQDVLTELEVLDINRYHLVEYRNMPDDQISYV